MSKGTTYVVQDETGRKLSRGTIETTEEGFLPSW